jgi:hypothetical protein
MQDFPFGTALMWPFLIPIVAIAGGIMVAIVSTISKGRVRELEIRERIAMIERGMVPPPEADPAGFERSLRSVEDLQYRHSGTRHRSAGIIVMSIGFGLMMLIAFTSGEVNVGIGVGGFLVILGFGLFLVSLWATPPVPVRPPAGDRRPPAPGNGPSGPVDLR